jgi:(R,R)-butanediol dehydrogenase / meso-butanediol dehydrogenase / diacetyl reductase
MTLNSSALVWRGRRNVALESRALPGDPPDGHVRIGVAWCGFCGSDFHEFRAGPVVIPHDRPGVQRDGLVLGHEFSGRVVAVGPDVGSPQVGQAVTSDTLIGCDSCTWCEHGQPNLCPSLEVVGLTRDGAFAEFVDVPAQTCFPLPPEMPLDVGAIVEPVAVALRAVDHAAGRLGQPVVVAGVGAIGLLCLQLARSQGAHPVLALERTAARAAMASEAGADVVLDGLDDLQAFDEPVIVLECTGNSDLLSQMLHWLPPGSRVVLVGVSDTPVELDLMQVLAKEIELVGSVSHDRADYRTAIDCLTRSELDLASLRPRHVDLASAGRALADLSDGASASDCLKVLVGPQGEPWRAE